MKNEKTEVDSFIVGDDPIISRRMAGISERVRKIETGIYTVKRDSDEIPAFKGDRVVLYSDGSFDVVYKRNGRK